MKLLIETLNLSKAILPIQWSEHASFLDFQKW
jgi:hypothetical protein